ncbi:MAG: STAS domain-containing protein [Gammaproteobacteria bacterium]|nr:STAS domain-containing protein [Gammaproteobacteria bacterium]
MTEFTITREGETLRLAGPLYLGGVMQALEKLRRELAHGSVTTLDLAGVSACDSSAVALILEMRRQGVSVIRHIPADMEAIVRACQLETLFAIDPSPSPAAGRPNHNEHS